MRCDWYPAYIGELVSFLRRFAGAALIAVSAAVASLGGVAPAHADRNITLTFVRHAQSLGNASGLIDSTVPGPDLTDLGYRQARAVANTLSANGYDGIYASTMVRTHETAAPLSESLGEPVTVLPGLREIEAGAYEGQPEANARDLFTAPMAWLRGDRDAQIPGSIDGNEFDARFDEAVATIYDSGDAGPVAFSHSGATMIWVLMNVKNPDMSLLTSDPLPNTGQIVVVGNPRDGWTLTDWDGTPVPR